MTEVMNARINCKQFPVKGRVFLLGQIQLLEEEAQ
jgi:hypothetical protein